MRGGVFWGFDMLLNKVRNGELGMVWMLRSGGDMWIVGAGDGKIFLFCIISDYDM